ncbi:MAG: CarD family transcriptional regulator [Oscillospiraceae bacterium]
MFKVNDKLAHPSDGACIVREISEKGPSGSDMLYYTLEPCSDTKMMLFVPVKNAERIGVRPVMTMQEADELLAYINSDENRMDCEWIGDHSSRIKHYKELFSGNTLEDLWRQCTELELFYQKEAEKKLPIADKTIMTKIEVKVASELAVIKDISYAEAVSILHDRKRREYPPIS